MIWHDGVRRSKIVSLNIKLHSGGSHSVYLQARPNLLV